VGNFNSQTKSHLALTPPSREVFDSAFAFDQDNFCKLCGKNSLTSETGSGIRIAHFPSTKRMIYHRYCFALPNPILKDGVDAAPCSNAKAIAVQWLRLTLAGLVLAVPAGPLAAAETNRQSPVSLSELADLPVEQLALIPIETVSGASRYEQKVTHAPASVSVVTSDEIKKLGYRTLADILQSLGGIYVTSDRN